MTIKGILSTKEYISNQKDYGTIPYGKKGTISGNGCGSIACHNYLIHHGYDIKYTDSYNYFNSRKNLVLNGRWGTNPFAIKKYMKKKFGFKVKMHFFRVPKKKLDSCIVLYVYKHKWKLSAHYVFGYMEDTKFITHNLNSKHESLSKYIKSENIVGKCYIVYEIKKN
jgi:hypothetical protein